MKAGKLNCLQQKVLVNCGKRLIFIQGGREAGVTQSRVHCAPDVRNERLLGNLRYMVPHDLKLDLAGQIIETDHVVALGFVNLSLTLD